MHSPTCVVINCWNFIDTSVCMPVKDNNWNIAWTSATRGQTVLQKCPGGHESLGMFIRICFTKLFIREVLLNI